MDVKSGWYPDPDGKPCARFWDGNNWTNKTRPITGTQITPESVVDEISEKLPDKKNEVTIENQVQKNKRPTRNLWNEFKVPLGFSFLILLGFYFLIQVVQNLSPNKEQPLLNQSAQTPATESAQTPATESNSKTDIPSREKKPEVRNSAPATEKPFTTSEIAALNRVKMRLYNHVEVWSGYVVGNNTFAEVANSCQQLSSAYDSIRSISSSREYSEDLLDRAKDYTFEAYRSCNNAIKKQDLNELGESVSLAGSGVAFFDQVLSGNK